MKKTLAFLAAGLLGGALLSYFLFSQPDGLSQREARELARTSGDSAVAAFRTSGEMQDLLVRAVGDALKDTVAFYEGEVRTAGVLEIRRDTVTVHDTVPGAPRPGLMRVLRWDPIDQDGLHVEETHYYNPGINPKTTIRRDLTISFDPDTLAIALLRLPNGIERLTGLMNETGEVVVLDAATWSPEPTTFDQLTRYVGAAGCVAAGFQLGRLASGASFSTGDWAVAGGGGALCAIKLLSW
jgi:hypothetical protein